MGAAWRDLAGKKSGFEKILRMVSEVRGMGMEGESHLVLGKEGNPLSFLVEEGNKADGVTGSLHDFGDVDT